MPIILQVFSFGKMFRGMEKEKEQAPLSGNLFSFIWLPNRDSNPNKQSQSLSCYRYTIRQCLSDG